jgi:lipopolysaccharide transport system permease protein
MFLLSNVDELLKDESLKIMYSRVQPRSQLTKSQLTKRQAIYYRDLLWELVSRELKLLYKRSLLGVAWTLINPLLQLALFTLVFRLILKAGGNIQHYLAYVFSSILIWTWTQSTLFQATGVITGNRTLLRQPEFPVAMLPVVTVMTGFIHFLLAMPALLIIMWFDRVPFTANLLLLPIPFFLQFILTLSFAYPLAAMNVTFRDTQHTLGVILQLMFYILPIFYSANDVIQNPQMPEILRQIYLCNPILILLQVYRGVLGVEATLPESWRILGLVLLSGLLLPIGYRIFDRQRQRFVEEV